MSDGELNEAAIRSAMASVDGMKPMHIVVTDVGLALQAMRFRDGDLTEQQMRDFGIPEDIIAEVKHLAHSIS